MTDSAADLPAPPLPADVDLKDMPKCMFDFDRLMNSVLWNNSTGDEFKAAFALWSKAWKQIPAASIENNERTILGWVAAGLPPGTSLAKIKKVMVMALHGFTLCSDGRLYHMILADDALRAWQSKLDRDSERDADRERLRRWRQAKRAKKEAQLSEANGDGTRDGTDVDTDVKRVSSVSRNTDETSKTVQDITGQDRKEESLAPTIESEPEKPSAPKPAGASVPGLKAVVEGFDWEGMDPDPSDPSAPLALPAGMEDDEVAKAALPIVNGFVHFRAKHWQGRISYPDSTRTLIEQAKPLAASGVPVDVFLEHIDRALGDKAAGGQVHPPKSLAFCMLTLTDAAQKHLAAVESGAAIVPMSGAPSVVTAPSESHDRREWRMRLKEFRDKGQWFDFYGPRPVAGKCRPRGAEYPQDIADDLGFSDRSEAA